MPDRRRILFLQGPPTTFWRQLAEAFDQAGHATFKITFSFGDFLYWRRPGAVSYRGRFRDWKTYLSDFVRRHGITDIMYYADRQPYHVIAAEVARENGVLAIVIENGYLRPDWLTLERDGMGAYSHFPADPQAILDIAAASAAPDREVRYRHGFVIEACNEVIYGLSSYFFWWFFPFYNADRCHNPVLGYLSHLWRLIQQGQLGRLADTRMGELFASGKPFFLVPLQLQYDYQVRANSSYDGLASFIDHVIGSFAAHAVSDAALVFKVHPMDNGLKNWSAAVCCAAGRHAVEDRVLSIDGGDLNVLLSRTKGCLVINSTAGLYAIRARCPTKVLGAAIFDIPGLAHAGPLDTFWKSADRINEKLADAFVCAIAATIQVKGSFYDPEGRKAAISQIVDRVAAARVNQPSGFVPVPPRLDRLSQSEHFAIRRTA